MMRKTILSFLLCSAMILGTGTARSTPVYDSVNGHWYDYVTFPDIGWAAAKAAAASSAWMGMSGHLATITDSSENSFIALIYHGNAYLGATDLGSPTEAYSWITGELFGYTNWGPGEPNNAPNSATGENFLMMWHSVGFPSVFATDDPDQWNDIFNFDVTQPIANNSNAYISGYFVEYEASEPETSVIFLTGLGLLGLIGRRRKQWEKRNLAAQNSRVALN